MSVHRPKMDETACIVLVFLGLLSIARCAKYEFSRSIARDKPFLKALDNQNQYPRPRAFAKQSQRPGVDPAFHASYRDAQKLLASNWEETRMFAKESTEIAANKPRIFFPTDNGADPSGSSDSTTALQQTINQAFDVSSSHSLLTGVIDLGGVEVHLGGGQYVISRPLTMPDLGGGNVLIHGGTIRASQSFPQDGYLIELASSETRDEFERLKGKLTQTHKSPVYEYITFRDLMLDANYIGGGILLLNALRTTIDNCYVTHFRTEGISVQGGHETMIRGTFLGQHITAGGDPGEKNFSGTAVVLAGNDNAVTDVVVFSAAVGISVEGQANILTGVHCYNKATAWGGVGIIVKSGGDQLRIANCYLDFTGIDIYHTTHISIVDSYFLGDGNILLLGEGAGGSGVVNGLYISGNIFDGSGRNKSIVDLNGKFLSVRQTFIDRNAASGMVLKASRARSVVKGYGEKWTLDLSSILLFPDFVAHVDYSFYGRQNQSATVGTTGNNDNSSAIFARHALLSVNNNQVTVASDRPILATVAISVDQSRDDDASSDASDLYNY